MYIGFRYILLNKHKELGLVVTPQSRYIVIV